MTQRKSILITGCSKGSIGDGLAQEFHRQGLRVFATARTLAKISHLQDMGIETLTLEVTSPDSIAEAVRRVSAITGEKLDYLLNNSGSGYNMPVTDVDISQAKQLFDVNFFAIIAVTQAFMPLLMKASGTVVNHTSIVAVAPLPFFGVYNASKAAVHSITQNMRLELKPLGVNVVEIMSGKVASNFFDGSGEVIPDSSYYAPVKQEVEFMLAGKTAKGQELDAMPGQEFAKKVASDLLKKSPSGELWRGSSASTVWIVTTFFSRAIQDFVLSQITSFSAVAAKLKGARA